MNITTAANVYDRVFAIKNNKVVEAIVTFISIEVCIKNKDFLSTYTDIKYETDLGCFTEDQIFLTKQALLDSL
jgi:hypothetical protein